MSTLISLTHSWFFAAGADEEVAHKRLTEAYRASVDERDKNVFHQTPSVLYALVTQDEWNSAECATLFPAKFDDGASLQLFAQIPRNRVARTCFAAEVASALVTKNGKDRLVNHTKIGERNRVAEIDASGVAKIANSTHYLVAVLLHDYPVVFANYYGDEWKISETKYSHFVVEKSAVFETKMFLARPLNKTLDLCVTFAPALLSARKVDYPPTVSDVVATPSLASLREALKANALTDTHKKLDIDQFFSARPE